MKAEEWRAIAGYEGIYEVSDQGRVRSLDRIVYRSNGTRQSLKGRVLKFNVQSSGHLQVALYRGASMKYHRVHRLVLEAFVGPCPEGLEACHSPDRTPSNNRVENLRWDTRSENRRDSVRHGTHSGAQKTHCPRGHPLESPNLVRCQSGESHRECLACNRAQSYLRTNPHLDTSLQELSDQYYKRASEGETFTFGPKRRTR